MAEFKLGRIRFVWKGDWTPSTTYFKDDVVRYGGRTYICDIGHTSASDFYTDLDFVPTRWNQMTDGQSWQGDWTTDNFYRERDIVKYGGLLYICNTSHTSASTTDLGLENDQVNWTLFAEGFDWKNDWTPGIRYKVNDIVSYGGITYVCNEAHTSAATIALGLENDQAKWDEYNEGIEYKGTWSGSSVRYKKNDVVKYGAGLWIATTAHTSTSTFADDESNWTEFVKGFEFEDDWSSSTVYQPGDIVRYGGNQYIALTNHSNTTPTELSNTDWGLFSEGFRFQSNWDIESDYKIGEVVVNNGYTYLATSDIPSTTLTIGASSSSDNSFTVTGGSTSTFEVGFVINFAGVIFGDIANSANYYVHSIINDTKFTITDTPGGSVITLSDDTGSMVAYTAPLPPSAGYWDQLSAGLQWQGEWQDDREYYVGDTVRYDANTYICVKNHRSEQDDGSTIREQGGGADNSRPDQDSLGLYWNLLSVGNETSLLSERGDLIFYGGSGPTRLPVGIEGQVLVAGENDPEWRTLGEVDHVYYVSLHGTDSPAPIYGKTLDQPWKTVRYAVQQVEDGPRNPNAKRLLELNRVFLQKEVTEFIKYQIANADPGSIWENFDYEDYKCERDVGLTVDALIYDISHGGNVKTRGVANSLVGAITEDSPGAYPGLAVEEEQSIAAYNYLETVIGNVLAQTAPSVNYQITNGDNSTAIVDQYFETGITSETGVTTTISSLLDIVTNAIDDGDASRVPARFAPANLIKVATGQYRETLPMIIPEFTAILGDELRSTNIAPSTGSTHLSDVKYSLESLGRMEEIIGDVVLGNDVTETSGNTATQSRDFPFADSDESTALKRLVRTIQQRSDFLTGAKALTSNSDPTNYNTSYLVGYGDARKLITYNKKFFQEQVIAFITASYTGLKYSRTKCRQDVGYIVDAIAYDLTYGGTYQTLVAGLAYYEGTVLQFDSSETTATLAAYNYLKSIMQAAALNNTVPTNQDAVPQYRDTAGSASASTAIGEKIDIITGIIENGLTGRPNITVTTIASNVITTESNHGLDVGDAIIPRSTSNGLIKNRTYWIISTPAADTFTVSETFGGSVKTLSNGTSLSIISDTVDYGDTSWASGALVTAAETLDTAQETIITAVVNQLNEVAYHTDFLVREDNLTNDDFEIYVGTNDITHTYVEGGTVTKSNGTILSISNFVYNESTGVATVTTSIDHGLVAGDEVDIENITVECFHPDASPTTQTTVYPSASGTRNGVTKILYDHTKCLRDTRLITEAVMYDFMFGSNFASTVAGLSYLRASASDVYDLNQKSITIDALDTVKTLALSNVGGDATAQSRITDLMDSIDAIIFGGSNEGSNCGTSLRNRDYAVLQIERNRDYIVSEINAWIADTFSDTATATTASTDVITISDTSWLQRNTAIQFTGTSLGGIVSGTTYYVYSVESSTTFKIAETRDATTAFSVSDDTGSMTLALVYNSALCTRDTNSYLDALKYDIKYSGLFLNNDRYIGSRTGNYKSLLAARYYSNSVTGSLEEDMFYCRNATGVRNCTLSGLTGDLLPENIYGTSRVSAGAYCSLDPGWGPDDYRAWIITRSPYIQGVTTFGTAAIGQKIDGALHNGGNDSITSNDFTQVISDGIGAWITNNGRAELVSVFSYYAHIGYLAENGGRIRGTNGNNSYGDFGSVSEGFDNRETPGTATVDNKFQFDATINSISVGGGELKAFQFDNAGEDYTEVTYGITGGGVDAEVEQDEFRDDGVFEVRLLDFGDDSSGQFGGEGYLTASNTAQGGTTSQITLAATDGETSTAYPGMKIVLTGGEGAGQYALINTYNSGTKIATVIRESDGQAGWDSFTPGVAIVAPNSSTTYTIEPALSFTSPGFSSTERTMPAAVAWKDAVYGDTTSSHTALTADVYNGSGVDATFDVIRNGWKYIITLNNGGSGYTRLETITLNGSNLGGTDSTNDIVITITSVNSVTGAILDFDWTGDGKGGVFVATPGSGSTGAYSDDGETWTSMSMPSAGDWRSVTHSVIDDGSTVLKTGRFVAVRYGSTIAAYSDDGETWNATTLPASANWISVTANRNGQYVAIADDSTTVAVSNDGLVWDISGTLNATGFVKVVYGKGKYVAVKTGDTDAVEYSTDGVTWTQTDFATDINATSVTYGSNTFVAVGDSNTAQVSDDGITWSDATIGSVDGSTIGSYVNVSYGQGLFIATSVGTDGDDNDDGFQYVMKSENGVYWESETVPTVGIEGATQINGYNAIAHGNPQRTNKWIAVMNSSGTHAVSINTGATTRARVTLIAAGEINAISITEPGSGYVTPPTITITDPNNIFEAPTENRTSNGVLANPSFINRGSDFDTAGALIDTADGYADFYQPGSFIAVRRISERPVAGSNVVFDSLPNQVFKLVNVLTFRGSNDGAYTAFYQVSPDMTIADAPDHLDDITTRLRYSQVRLTGHDFLDIGTGNFTETNYPGEPTQPPIAANETVESNGGRVFYTSTDQDGNFRVGDLFSIEQSTGIATLNADAFNISGLQELNLGNVTLGGGSATVTEFSADPFFTANSDNVVPTQRAIRAYIASQIGGGGASLVVNSVTSGNVVISTNAISHIGGGTLLMDATFDFRRPVTGYPLAFNYFLT